ncbi:RasGEF domain-containing protein [Pleurostoma richardsiae]|uniref:RasGEF domain-containing protein n=1 Tax=Pleurostoma richardsiae TaxID=41990 RepID=A0AA38RKS3_9PEZI|nr:RasGEF domain-containing protein [Pleurostoma richardsiae]
MRPSFEAEAQKLAQIPDDADDDGGVESALLKLEGKYEKRSPKLLMEPTRVPPKISSAADLSTLGQEDFKEKKKHRHEHVGDEGVSIPLTAPSENTPVESFLTVPSNTKPPNDEARSFLSDDSTGSYSSIPLLQRGLTDEGRRSKAEWTNHSILQGPEEGASTSGALSEKDSEHSSYEFVRKTKSMEKIEHGAALPGSAGSDEKQSFFNDDSDEEGELSSELSEECVEEDFYDSDSQVAFPPVRADTVISRLAAGSLGEAQGIAEARDGPPSPPITLTQALAMYPETAGTPEVHDHQLWDDKPLPPTPETTPTTAQYAPSMTSPGGLTGTEEALRNAHRMAEQQGPRSFSVHLPFILAFDSEVLAQQFTLIEKDALNEIDWKELIEMRWKNADNIDSRSWVDFLRNTEAHGVEVVIARFNIMVKWAVSEIVLTQDLEERARCTIKLIHIAAHCRRYRNFATMSQIAIALSSNEITRLTKTWSFVPPTDMRTLRDLESLVSPTRNFYNLRAEMEGADIASADMGCIPFVGIYTHDLIFNAQRPSEIASSPTTAPLVNFERCRIAASIVKTLLRLLEASTLYTFQPVEGITERCLWMSALKDDDIRRRSESLE